MHTMKDRDHGKARRARIAPSLLGRALAGAVVVIGLVGLLPTTGTAESAESSGGRPLRTRLELAQAGLEADGGVAVIITAVDFVDAIEGPGTNTAVDVLFPTGECHATGPIDFRPDGLRRAAVAGELIAECFDVEENPSFPATVTVELEWDGFGPVQRIPFPDDPADPCRIHRVERRAVTSGTVTVDGPDGGLVAIARPIGAESDVLVRQRDACRVEPVT